MRWTVLVIAMAVGGCEKPIHSYNCSLTRSCPGVDPTTVVYLSICGSSPEEAELNVCKGETCSCAASCTLASSDPLFC